MTQLPRLPPAYRLVAFERLASTNEEAKRFAAEGAKHGTLVWAREQTAGRGRRGRSWHSPPGNLYLSLVLRPDCAPAAAAQLGMVAAVAAGEALESIMPALVKILLKWPNDILVNDSKVGGILLESAASKPESLEWLVLGLGINVESFPEGTEFPATSLGAESGQPVTVEEVLESFCQSFLRWDNTWRERGFAPVRRAWLGRAWKRGKAVQARIENEKIDGVFRDLDDDGALLLELPSGTSRRITAADVFAFSAAV